VQCAYGAKTGIDLE